MIFNSNKGLPPRSGLQVAFGAIGIALLGATAGAVMTGPWRSAPEKCAAPIEAPTKFPRTRFPSLLLPATTPRNPENELSWRQP